LFVADSSTPTQRPKSGRRAPHVHGHVEDRSRRDPHQLALRLGVLEMQAAQHATLRTAVIVLTELRGQSGGRERLGVPALEEEAALVAEHPGFDHDHAGQTGFDALHRPRGPSRSMVRRYSP
jgi:hypothetical protein